METLLKGHLTHKQSKTASSREMMQLLRRGDCRAALAAASQALESFPLDPFFTSYYGYLVAAVENKHKEGARICEDVIKALGKAMPEDMELFFPVFYLNLGRTHVIGGRRKEAIEAFREGLKYDPRSRDLITAISKLGSRKKPVISFLHRSNPVNVLLGRLRHALQKNASS